MTDITQADIAKLKEAAEKVIASRQEAKDPLNKSGEVGQRVFDRKRFIADNEFFKLLDWHGEYGQPIDGPHKILAIIAEREALREALKQIADTSLADPRNSECAAAEMQATARAALGDKP